MPETDILSSRLQAIQVFGGSCASCANQDIRVLRIVNTNKGEGAALRRKVSREKYFLLAIRDRLTSPETCPYTILCANCQAIRLACGEVPAVVSRHVLVWKPECSLEMALASHPWLEGYVNKGFEVFVYHDKMVYRYKDKQVMGGWSDFQVSIKSVVDPPVDSTITFEVAA